VNPLIWIRLLAYGDRVVFERQRRHEAGGAASAGALRSRIIGELRGALGRALAPDSRRHARGTVVRSDHSAEGFLITTRGGPHPRTLQVSPSGTGVECSYGGASDAVLNDAVYQGRLQVSFPSQQLIPAVILENGLRMKCDTANILCEQLLERLGSRPTWKAERRNSTASTEGRRLEKVSSTNLAGARP
jgi:hypothetical protein